LDTLPAQLGPEALNFNGTDQFLARQGVSGLGLTALTLEAWILVESVEDSIIFAWDNAAENLTRIEFGINTQGQLRFRSDAVNSGVAYLSQESVVANTLSHVVVTVAEGAVHFYINGDFSSSVAASAPPAFQIPGANDGDQLFIGRGLNGGYFHGRIAEVRLWNVVRTNDQLGIYRHRRVPGRSPHLIGYWPLTQVETEGTVLDASSNQNHLALGGVLGDFQPQRLTVDLALPTPPIEVPGTVLSFDGDNDVIAIGQPRKSLGLGAFEKITIEFWFKPADIANRSSNTQLLYTHGDAEAGLSIYCVDQQVYCVIWTANYERTTVQETVWVSDIIAPDQWHHVAVVNDESPTLDLIEFHAYLNGQELGFDSSTHSNAALSNNQKAYHLSPVGAAYLGGMNRRGVTRIKGDYIEGEAHYQHYFAGSITDFRWWKTARSAADIEQQRYGAPALTDGDLLVYGPMAEGEGLTIVNRAVAAEGSHGEQNSGAKKSEVNTGYVAPGKQTGQSPLDVPASGELQQRNITVFNRDTQATFEQTYAHYQPNGVDVLTWSNYEYRGRLYIAATDGGIGVTVYNRFVEGSDRFYRLWRHPLQPTFVLSSRDSGRESLTGTLDSGVTPEPGSWYRFAVQIQTGADATTLRAKIWLGNTDEPDFQMEAVDVSPIRLTSGTVGLWSFGAGQKHFDDLKLALLNPDGTVQDQRLLDENFESYRVDVNPADWVGTVDRPNYITDADIFQVTTVPETVVLGIDGNNDTAHAYYGPPSGNDPGTWTHYEYQGRI
ncbi:MAG: LamG domain-containing protein, partial [Cyanobacteria bacterium P01_F01_bin.116]